MWAALTIPVLWLAAILAYAYEDGMNVFVLMGRFSQVIEYPFAIGWKPHTPKFMLISIVCYAMGIGLYYTSRENRRPGEEYGSAKWGSPKQLCQKYMDHKNPDGNVILTQNVMIGMDGHKHRRNLNILGGRQWLRQDPFLLQTWHYERQLFLSHYGPQGRNAPRHRPASQRRGLRR